MGYQLNIGNPLASAFHYLITTFQVRESKRARKQVSQFESPDPEIQQIMKTIKLQEQVEKQNKAPNNSMPAAAKANEEIEDEEMPLKIKGKSRGRPKGAGAKESPKPTPAKVAEVATPISETSSTPSKKEAVFFK